MSTPTLPQVRLYQLAYSPETLASIQPGYLVLDNLEQFRLYSGWRAAAERGLMR